MKRVQIIFSDFDGVHTDGHVYVDQNGVESVRCSRRDGLGISMLKRANIPFLVISKETNPVVAARCKKMNVECTQSVFNGEDKLDIILRVCEERGVSIEEACYIGDDINDIPALASAGLSVAVADAHPAVLKIAKWVLKARGGEHAIRELVEEILTAKKIPIQF